MRLRLRLYLLALFNLLFALQLLAHGIDDLNFVLSHAGQNRSELELVLKHYEQDTNKEKLAAVQFLIGNMRWHISNVPLERHHHNSLLDSLTHIADSTYFNCISRFYLDSIGWRQADSDVSKATQSFRDIYNIKNDRLRRPVKSEYDYKVLSATELIWQIDYAFSLRERVSIVKQLKFEDFCEYILPYRSISDYPLMDLPQSYFNLLGKYFINIPQDSILDKIQRYNVTLRRLKGFFPKYPYDEFIGYQELFFKGFHDCISIAQYGASTLRMLGIPTAVEFNVAYKELQGTHYMCSVLMSDNKWMDFNPQSGIPFAQHNDYFERNGSMNVYRFMFASQKDTPFFLHGKDEFVPEELRCPFIKDVSSRLLATTTLQLPFSETCDNQVAYLATYSSEWDDGLLPVTWAQIDKDHKKVVFMNVVTERIYFPVYFSSKGEATVFSNPFYVNKLGQKSNIPTAKNKSPELCNVTRKYPWKPKLKQYSETLIGTVVLASNDSLMIACDTVACISSLLKPYFQDIVLDTCKGPYTYYQIKTPQKSSHEYIAEIQFLTDKSFGYENVCKPSPLAALQPDDIAHISLDEFRLLDDSFEKTRLKEEYDGNSQTAPSYLICFKLKQPQYVTKIRLMPIHADNGVNPNDLYQLLHWKGNKWVKEGELTTQYNLLPCKIVKGDMYWLRNLSKGKEELPFVIDESDQQKFIYFDIMND